MSEGHGMKESWERNEKEDMFDFHTENDHSYKDGVNRLMQSE
jgi:hypothetical protein